MNPAYGLWPADEPRCVAPMRARLSRRFDARWRSTWADLVACSRVVRDPPPSDQATWLAWARGEAPPGPRWVSVRRAEVEADLARYRRERAAQAAVEVLGARVQVGPWEQHDRWHPRGPPTERWVRRRVDGSGRRILAEVYAVGGYTRTEWWGSVWPHPPGEESPHAPTRAGCCALVDAVLRERGVMLADGAP